MKFLDKKLDEWILIFSFSVILALVFAQVVFRYLVHIPIIGLFDELARFLFVWIAWISVSYSIRTDSHIRIEIFSDIVFKNKKNVIKYIENILFLGFAIFLVVEGYLLALDQIERGFTSPLLQVPLWIVTLGIPISGVLMVIRLIQELVGQIRNPKGKLTEKQE